MKNLAVRSSVVMVSIALIANLIFYLIGRETLFQMVSGTAALAIGAVVGLLIVYGVRK